jgi:hypothetical protein
MDKSILAARLERADERLKSAATALSARFGISGMLIHALNNPPKTSDPDVKRMSLLENVAGILESILGSDVQASPRAVYPAEAIVKSESTEASTKRGKKDQ